MCNKLSAVSHQQSALRLKAESEAGYKLKAISYEDLLGAPFKYRGGSVAEGFDCWNLIRELYRRLGTELPEFAYNDEPGKETIHSLIAAGHNLLERLDTPEPYCMVMFRIHPRFVTHIGMVMPSCRHFIHIMRDIRVSVEPLDSILWEKKIEGFYRWK